MKKLKLFLALLVVMIAGLALSSNSYAATAKSTQKITVKANKKKLKVGKTTTLRVKGAKGKLTFKSSNTKVATVNSKGKITAKKAGTATITVKAAATSKYKATSVKIKITVTNGSSGTSSSTSSSRTVYITKTGAKYHTGWCRYLWNSKIAIKLRDAVRYGYTACSVCRP